MSYIPQCSRPFADCFIIGKISARATNNCSKWVRIPVEGEGQLRKFKCVSQKLLGFSPHFVMSNDCKHGFQISVHRIAHTTCLKIIPGTTNPLKPSHEPSFWSFAFSLRMWPA
jgi:hypothetical protein